jgi:hypothetical protein
MRLKMQLSKTGHAYIFDGATDELVGIGRAPEKRGAAFEVDVVWVEQ